METGSLLAGAGVLLAIVWIWFAVYYWLNPQLKNPDAKARMTGTCGDTMEIGIQFDRKHVAVKTCCWTDGCITSLNCIHAAADLAKGKSVDAILDIDADAIQRSIGGLPKEHWHCATLAASTLHAAMDDYMNIHNLDSEPSLNDNPPDGNA
jgi:NifU-like protein involved in Fe-S cluster formation